MKHFINFLSDMFVVLFMMLVIAGTLSVVFGIFEFLSWVIFGQFFHFF